MIRPSDRQQAVTLSIITAMGFSRTFAADRAGIMLQE